MKELIKKIIPKLKFKFPYEIDDYSENLYMENYHKHTYYSNIKQIDCATSIESYIKKTKEYNYQCLFSGEHGWQGQYLSVYKLCEANKLKFRYSTEAYWVKNRLEKDNKNCHIVLVAKNYEGLEELNYILSIANEDGYYYKPRLDLELLLSLNPNNVIVTSACIAGWKYDDAEEFWLKIHNHFKDNFFLEVQNHNTDTQKQLNKQILKLSKQHNIQLIAGLDTHYIDDEDNIKRDKLLERKKIFYDDEDGWYMDFPNGEETYKRFSAQGILNKEEILTSIMNTCVFINECEDIVFDKSFKIPNLYKEMNYDERGEYLKKFLLSKYEKEDYKTKEKLEGVFYEFNEINESKVIDYFLTNERIINTAVNKFNGILTTTGRGSASSYIINKLLGFTTIDRFTSDIPIYPERFLTKERILSHQMPDIDFNIAEQEPFVKASRELLGEHSCYPLIAFGTLQEKASWKLYAGVNNITPEIAEEIGKSIDKYNEKIKYCETDEEKESIDILEFIPEQYVDIYTKSKDYQGIIDNSKAHACFVNGTLVLTSKGYKNIEDISVGDFVLTHNNKYEQVIQTMKNKTNELIDLKITGDNIQVTPNHPFFIISKNGHKYIKKQLIRQYSEPYWKEAGLLNKDDYVGFAINSISKLPIQIDYSHYNKTKTTNIDFQNKDFWWLIGRYIGDGWYETARKQTIICCNKKNDELIEIIKKIPSWVKYRIDEYRTSYKITTHNRDIYEFVQQFGKYSYGKFINNTIIDLPVELLEEFLNGYLSADGCVESNGITFKTVSKELAYGIQQCIHKVYQMPCTIRTINPTKHTIEGRDVNCRKKYNGRFKKNKCKSDVNFFKDGYIWVKVKDVSLYKKECSTYNLSVSDDNSYTVQNMIVHNCGHLILEGDIRKKVGIIRCVSETTGKNILTTVIDGSVLDEFGYVKNDYLIVDVVALIDKFYKSIGKSVPTFDELRKLIKDDEKTWDIYAKGFTVCINQCEKTGTTNKGIKYKAQTIEELSAFIAGIRPGFKSLINNFIDRKPYTTGEASIDELLKSSYHYLIYQESIMMVLNFLGVNMQQTYDIVKSISKKKLKGKKKNDLDKQLQKSWMKIFGNMNNYSKVWNVIEDSARYAFNSPHAWAMAGDSLYSAYFKANYTSNFYEEALNHYMNKKEKDKVKALMDEAKNNFGYKIGSFEYGKDNSKFTIDDNEKIIYPNLSSIKGIGEKVTGDLLEFSKKGYRDIRTLYLNTKGSNINKTVFTNLIKIGYFKKLGTTNYLLQIIEILDYFSGVKELSQEKLSNHPLGLDFFKNYGRCTAKKIVDVDIEKLIEDLINKIEIQEDKVTDIIKNQIDILKSVYYVDLSFRDDIVAIQEINTNQWGTTFLTLYRIKDGSTATPIKVDKQYYNFNSLSLGDIIQIDYIIEKPKKRKIDGKFVELDEKELILTAYHKLEEL